MPQKQGFRQITDKWSADLMDIDLPQNTSQRLVKQTVKSLQ